MLALVRHEAVFLQNNVVYTTPAFDPRKKEREREKIV